MLENNLPAVIYANHVIKGCIGDCFDMACDGELEEVTESEEFKILYASLIRLSILLESGLSSGHKGGEVRFAGDGNYAAVSIAEYNIKRKHLESSIKMYTDSFNKYFESLGLNCHAKKECEPCACKKPSCNECGSYEMLDFIGL